MSSFKLNLLIALIMCFSISMRAQTLDPVSIEQLANSNVATDQYRPEIASHDDGSYVVCWQEGGWDGGTIHARRFTNSHDPIGDEVLITNQLASTIRIKHYQDDQYVIGFKQFNTNDLYFLTFDASDASVSSMFLVEEGITNFDFDLKGDEIVWLYDEDTSAPQIFLRAYSLNTNDWVNNEVLVSEDSGNTYERPNIIIHSDGTMTAVYNYLELVSGCCTYERSIYRKTFSAEYLAQIPEHSLWTMSSEQYVVNGGLTTAGNGNDEVFIATTHGNTFSGRYWRGWIIDRDGEMIMEETIFASSPSYDWYGEPQVHLYDNGDFVLVSTHRDEGWQDADGSDAWALYAANYNAENTGWIEMNSTIPGPQEFGCLAPLPNGGFVAAWEGNGFQGDEQGIYVRAYNSVAFPGVRIEYVGDLVTDENGGDKQVEVSLATQPSTSVTVNLETDNPSEGTVDTEQLFFSAENWDIPQTITLHGQDDGIDDGNMTYNLIASTSESLDAVYAALADRSFEVVNLDDDATITPPGDQEFCRTDGLEGVNTIINNNGDPITSVTVYSNDQSVIEDTDILVMQINTTTWQISIAGLVDNDSGTTLLTILATDGSFEYQDTFEVTTAGINIGAGMDVEVCVGTSVTLTAENPDGAEFTWSDDIEDGVPFTPAAGIHTYTLTATDGICEVSDEVIVQVNDIPQTDLSAGEDLSVCEGSSITLTAFNPEGFELQWSDGIMDGQEFEQEIGTISYTVSAMVDGCVVEDEVVVEVYSAPDIDFMIEGNSEACEGDELTLAVTATEELSISWTNGVEDGIPFLAIAGETTYTASASHEGCVYEASITVVVQEALTSELDAGEDVEICEGEQITLEAYNPDGLDISWDQGVVDGQPFEPTDAEQTYTVTGTLGMCSVEDMIAVTVIPLPPVPTITYFGGELISSSAVGNQWYINGGIIPNETGQYIDPLTDGDYVVTVTIDGCTSSSEPYTFIADHVDEFNLIANVYPNPTSDGIIIELEGAFFVEIMDTQGRLLSSGQGQNNMRLDIEHLSSGIYFVRVIQGKQTTQLQIIKQ